MHHPVIYISIKPINDKMYGVRFINLKGQGPPHLLPIKVWDTAHTNHHKPVGKRLRDHYWSQFANIPLWIEHTRSPQNRC